MLPVWAIRSNRHLGLAKGKIVPFLALFDHAFERAVRHIGIARAKQQERRQDAAQSSISVLKWMDLEKNNGEDRGDQKRM